MFVSVQVETTDDLRAVFQYAHDHIVREPDIAVGIEDGKVGIAITAEQTQEEFLAEWKARHNNVTTEVIELGDLVALIPQ